MELGSPIAKGNTATIYRLNNKIVKVFNDYFPDTESVKEAKKQIFAHSCGLPVPKVLEVTKINGSQAIVMEYIRGETLGDVIQENKEQLGHYLRISVDVQINIHSIKPQLERIEPMHTKLSRQIEASSKLSKIQKFNLLRRLDSITYENRLCHGDFHLFNLIKTDNEVFVIDWVDSSIGDVCADVCRTYLLYSQLSQEIADLYVQLYCEKSGIAKSEVFQWAPIIAGARLSENVSTENSERLMKFIDQ
ncbi:phosphotransferase family protein [Ornithinibacillus halophilus]|uniref:Phosphotransferase enzyme family protein n=1 Tax=Ornithinibacillus halophilus TaxID=930117 RepID=A0A1M5JZ68_9BACI|nr:aminoglycoside phosphotransferase family protein [Ornithinibacillus halophilus]SHG45808.1 Phosphotransferase enzyme family protein [Ornithinibacillus halophilus]